MKKPLLLIICFLYGITSFAQEIAYDKIENGERSIMCVYKKIRSLRDRTVFSVALMAEQDKEKNVSYFLSLRATSDIPITVKKGGTLLIKLNDDSILELHTQMEYTGTIRDINRVKGSMYFDFTLNPTFQISKEQISQISEGVKKIRLVTTTGYIDKELKKYKIGDAIKAQYELIQEKLKETTSITDGF